MDPLFHTDPSMLEEFEIQGGRSIEQLVSLIPSPVVLGIQIVRVDSPSNPYGWNIDWTPQ